MKLAIVGAGLLGRLIAWRLMQQAKPVEITLFDSDLSGNNSAARVAAAMLAPLSELVTSEPVVANKGMQSIQLWRQWSQELLAQGIDINFQQEGSVVVAHGADQGDFQLFVKSLYADIGKTKIDSSNIELINRDGLEALEPTLAKVFHQACFLKPEGSLDNIALLDGLKNLLDKSEVKQIEKTLADMLDEEFLSQYDKVIDCRGFSAKKQWSCLHEKGASNQTLRGVRGEVIRVFAPDVVLTRPVRLMHPRYQLYIAPKPNHEFVIGATQIESESEHAITTRSSLELLSALYSVDTGFAESEVLETHAKCRPAFIDHLPAIVQQDNLLCVNGLYRHGYLLSPVVVEQVFHCLEFSVSNHWPEIVQSSVLHFDECVSE